MPSPHPGEVAWLRVEIKYCEYCGVPFVRAVSHDPVIARKYCRVCLLKLGRERGLHVV